MKLARLRKYYYLRFLRLRGEPHELALGMAFGVFTAMLPIIPFHTAFAIALAFIFKASKITSAIGVWVSNPLNWYILYYINYRIGAFILGLSRDNKGFSSFMESIRQSEEGMALILKIASNSGIIIAAFVIGGLIMGVVAAVPSYFIFLRIFSFIRAWRREKRRRKIWRELNQ
ncbi:DUF2062 domain-containing protein [Deltaproteobacteria bacterium]|nr:DUF2062 domain-containing protein [Deltaproteobacteria bacterium]